jgi:hypothetical protein
MYYAKPTCPTYGDQSSSNQDGKQVSDSRTASTPDDSIEEIQKLIQIVVIPLYRWIGLAVFVCERKKARASEQYRASERKQCRQEHIPTSPTSAASFPFAPCAITSNGFPIPPFPLSFPLRFSIAFFYLSHSLHILVLPHSPHLSSSTPLLLAAAALSMPSS